LPLYEYQCPKCGRFELIHKFSDAPLSTCPTCGSEVQKLPSAPAIQFKGTGWYITDYARKGAGKDGKGEASKSEGAKTEGAKTEGAKTEGAKESAGSSDAKPAAAATTTKDGGTKTS
jgi:putative FmdB family regulatory protein